MRGRNLLANLISFLPSSSLRCAFYRLFFGYKIEKTKLGLGVKIVADKFEIKDSSIGNFCKFIGPIRAKIEESQIGENNRFLCGNWTLDKKFEGSEYKRTLHLCRKSLITPGHYFDLAGEFTLGEKSWIAGTDSQFWTHGAGVQDRDITIGERCYIGSAARFAPGASIGDNCVVAMGSVVAKKFDVNNVLLGGVPAKVIREDTECVIK